MIGALLLILGMVAATLFEGFVVMLLAAGLHAYVSESVPALGFWPSVLVALALNVVGGFFRR